MNGKAQKSRHSGWIVPLFGRDKTSKMDPNSMFQPMLNFDIGTMRLMTAVAGISTLVLYLYQFHAIYHCMCRAPCDFPTPVDRVVWCGLSGFMPLGIGAYLYHLVSSRSPLHLLFFIPFLGVVIPAIYMLLKIWPNSTNFNFHFLGI